MAALGLWPIFLVGCEEQLPVAIGDQALPGEPVTIEITVPWSDFASNLEVFGGYGSPEDLGSGVLANQYEGHARRPHALAVPHLSVGRSRRGRYRRKPARLDLDVSERSSGGVFRHHREHERRTSDPRAWGDSGRMGRDDHQLGLRDRHDQ